MSHTYEFPRPAVTTDVLLLVQQADGYQVLLIERRNPPFKEMWALPGGFLDMDETLEECATRELKEETGVIFDQLNQLKAYSDIKRDPRQRTITIVFYAILDYKPKITAGDDAADAQWFSIKNLPKLAFDHQRVIDDFIGIDR